MSQYIGNYSYKGKSAWCEQLQWIIYCLFSCIVNTMNKQKVFCHKYSVLRCNTSLLARWKGRGWRREGEGGIPCFLWDPDELIAFPLKSWFQKPYTEQCLQTVLQYICCLCAFKHLPTSVGQLSVKYLAVQQNCLSLLLLFYL